MIFGQSVIFPIEEISYLYKKTSLVKIYTKTGDKGETSLLGGKRVSKDDIRIESYGTVDELNAHIGLLISELSNEKMINHLQNIQSLLFTVGSYLASESDDHPSLPILDDSYVKDLESAIDQMDKELDPMTSFILPSGSKAISQSHVCRTVCRRAERRIIAAEINTDYSSLIIMIINRLSDYFFVLGRMIAKKEGVNDVPWVPNRNDK